MTDIHHYADRPLAFLVRYLRMRWIAHMLILVAVLGAVACSVGTQYGVKLLVDTLSAGPIPGKGPWTAFAVLVALIASDNMLWRVASWTASYSFVHVTGDVRRDLFRHLTKHAPSYFADQLPGALTSRISATSNATFAIENMFIWNVLPPCAATIASIAFLITVSKTMAGALVIAAGIAVVALFRLASRGRPLHHDFADKAAAVDGEMIDVVGNMALVKAFCGMGREHRRFETTVNRELQARRRSLVYLEKLRLIHAVITVVLTLALLAWAVELWQSGAVSVGDVVLVCTLSISVLSATRDLAVALVDVTQHMARLAEALQTLLVPPTLCDQPHAMPLVSNGGGVTFENVAFRYQGGQTVFEHFNLTLRPGERVGLVGPSGGGKSTLIALLQRFYDVEAGRILIDGQDIARITQDSLHHTIAVVPQDTALFNRTLRENIRYGRPDASDAEVWAAAVAARCGRIIKTLPYGLDTLVGDRGVKLSGGQRQRIAIARAFLKDAPILLLDEATSALDSEVEEAIREALSRLMQGRTVIAIAHRLSTLRDFDRIVLLHGGRLVQDGQPELLLRQTGPYRDLVEREVSRLSAQAA
jgi:ATP-binding cassette, subfamily B, bacterial